MTCDVYSRPTGDHFCDVTFAPNLSEIPMRDADADGDVISRRKIDCDDDILMRKVIIHDVKIVRKFIVVW